jgi:hypothetical protein
MKNARTLARHARAAAGLVSFITPLDRDVNTLSRSCYTIGLILTFRNQNTLPWSWSTMRPVSAAP